MPRAFAPEEIQAALDRVPWRDGDRVVVAYPIRYDPATGDYIREDRPGVVLYRYYNGYTLVEMGRPISGGILSNSSTFDNRDIRPA